METPFSLAPIMLGLHLQQVQKTCRVFLERRATCFPCWQWLTIGLIELECMADCAHFNELTDICGLILFCLSQASEFLSRRRG